MGVRILLGFIIFSFVQAKSLSINEPKKHGHSQFGVLNCDGKSKLNFPNKNIALYHIFCLILLKHLSFII